MRKGEEWGVLKKGKEINFFIRKGFREARGVEPVA